jgi:hypothetical protein
MSDLTRILFVSLHLFAAHQLLIVLNASARATAMGLFLLALVFIAMEVLRIQIKGK